MGFASKTFLLVTLMGLAPALAYAQNGTVPTTYTDHSAVRVDAEVFGWSEDFREMAAIALSTHRNARGGQRGEVLLVVWDVNRIEPIESIQTSIITAAELAHAPIPLPAAKDKMEEVDYNLGTTWPMRPRKTRPDGWMTVDTIWDPIHVNARECVPAVAFVLSNGEALRFQAHQPVSDLRAPCDQLRMGHTRTYWAKPDLAVVMARFDYSPDDHEMSFRQPVSAKWNNAQELRFLVRTADATDPRTLRVVRDLGRYGRVRVVAGSAQAGTNGITTSPRLKLLGERFAKELGLPLSNATPEGDVDVIVTLSAETPTKRYGTR